MKKILDWIGEHWFEKYYRFYNPDKIPLVNILIQKRQYLKTDFFDIYNGDKDLEIKVYEVNTRKRK